MVPTPSSSLDSLSRVFRLIKRSRYSPLSTIPPSSFCPPRPTLFQDENGPAGMHLSKPKVSYCYSIVLFKYLRHTVGRVYIRYPPSHPTHPSLSFFFPASVASDKRAIPRAAVTRRIPRTLCVFPLVLAVFRDACERILSLSVPLLVFPSVIQP